MPRQFEIRENLPMRIELIVDEDEFHIVRFPPLPPVVKGRLEFHFSSHPIMKALNWNQGEDPLW